MDLSEWAPLLGCAGKLREQPVSDLRRIKPGAPAERQPSLQRSCQLFLSALDYMGEIGLKVFRLPSTFCPYATHPQYPEYAYARQLERAEPWLEKIRERVREDGLRLSFHPSQYVLLSSPRSELTELSVRELEWQAELLDRWGCGPEARILLHGGGVYGEREKTAARLLENIKALPEAVLRRFALENDEYSWNAEQLLPICRASGLPLILDLHHHALNPGHTGWEDALQAALESWNGVPAKIHLSSPREPGASSVSRLRAHAEWLDAELGRSVLAWLSARGWGEVAVMLESKGKEQAVLRLRAELR